MRYMQGDAAVAYRAVIVREYPEYTDSVGELHEAWTSTTYHGPYGSKAAAKAAITRATEPKWWDDPRVDPKITGYVEKSSVAWEVVE